jgi:hypothetical protein
MNKLNKNVEIIWEGIDIKLKVRRDISLIKIEGI